MTGIPVAPGELVDTTYLNEVARAHYRKTTAKAVVNTVTETDLLNGEVTIGAGAMAASRALRLTAWGDWINNSGGAVASPRFKLKLGATTIFDTNIVAAAWNASSARQSWRFVAEIANLGATNSQWASMLLEGSAFFGSTAATAFTTGEGVLNGIGSSAMLKAQGGNSAAVDTTAALALVLSVVLPVANAALDVTLKSAIVEIV